MRALDNLYQTKEQLNYELIEADGERYEEILEQLEEIEMEIEEIKNYGFLYEE